ncbi:SMI1/KNR4 family protein [Carboxylicivirga sp. RSCT41]|uniref:SMI1/KNR4 family protein n=1 Tax=Carboxylicivirga agarovorans TaxID=3417570 RepID=UPI003D32EFB7
MSNIEILETLKNSIFTDEDGEDYSLEFQDGLSDTEISKLQTGFPSETIDDELIEILKETRGWDGYGLGNIDFSSIGQFGFTELSPHSISLGHDGFGNFWILDILNDGSLGHVYYACHDPAVFIKYSDNLNEFLKSLIDFYESPSENYLNEIHDNVVFDVWQNGSNIHEKVDFITNNNQFADFLNEFEGDDWLIADLRRSENKDGFAWGKLGPNSLVKRHTTELIWVIRKRKKGFLARLFGK